MHASPADAVEIFKDVRAKRALAMHWGCVDVPPVSCVLGADADVVVLHRTWTVTSEPTMEPPELLREACAEAGLSAGTFDVCALGETVVVS